MRLPAFFRRGAFAALAALTLLATGCEDAVGLDDIPGTYILYAVDGDPLPALEYDDEYERQEFVAGSITLLADGDWTASTTYRVTTYASGSTRTEVATGQGIYSVVGDRVRLASGITGELSDDRLDVTAAAWDDRVLRYRKAR